LCHAVHSILEASAACSLILNISVPNTHTHTNTHTLRRQAAAGAALAALYALHPTPSTLATPLLKALLARALVGGAKTGNVGANTGNVGANTSNVGWEQRGMLQEGEVVRLLFLSGHVAMHQLVGVKWCEVV